LREAISNEVWVVQREKAFDELKPRRLEIPCIVNLSLAASSPVGVDFSSGGTIPNLLA
jgi:hypothetical protein